MAGSTVTIAKHAGLVDGSRFYRIGQEGVPPHPGGSERAGTGCTTPVGSQLRTGAGGDTFQIAASHAYYLDEPFVGREGFAGSFFTVVVVAVDSSQAGVYTYEVAADLYRREQGVLVPFAPGYGIHLFSVMATHRDDPPNRVLARTAFSPERNTRMY